MPEPIKADTHAFPLRCRKCGSNRLTVPAHSTNESIVTCTDCGAAIGEHLDGTPLEKEVDERSPRAVKAGQLGGLKGGKARAKKLSSSRRRAIARKAAATRWKSEN